jgi:Bacterial capsule synthesis protein PGA_cap
LSRRAVVACVAVALALGGAAEAAKAKAKAKKRGKKAAVAVKAPPAPPPTIAQADALPPLAPFPPGSVRIAAVGDVMMGTTFPDDSGGSLSPDDGAAMLAEVTPFLTRADLTFGNLEGPMLEGGVSAKCGPKPTGRCYAFRVPPRYAALLQEAGFDVMSVANNHAMDFGDAGRKSSLSLLAERGLVGTGEPDTYAVTLAGGQRIAVVAFATYAHSNNLNDLAAATDLVTRAGAEADLVIVSFHGGAEGAGKSRVPAGEELFYNENRGDLRTFSHAMIDAGADLVIGHGPHVVRAMEVYRGRLVAYSLGNFATYGAFNLKGLPGLSFILEATLAPDGTFVGGQATPVKQISPGGPKLDPTGEVLPILRGLSRGDFPETAVKIGADGRLAP